MKKRQVLVTGACGFLGSHLVDALLTVEGLSVRATDVPEADKAFLNPKAEFIPSDLRTPESLQAALRGVKVVYHAGALFKYSANWDDLYTVNVEGTRHLCQTAINAGVSRLMLVSSAGIYGIPRTSPVREDDPKDPVNPYDQSKWEQEQIVQKTCSGSKLAFTILRPAPIYGPRNRYGIGTILRMVAKGQLQVIHKNMNTLVPLVSVFDVVGAAIHLTDYPTAVGEVYNVVDDSTYQKYELLSYLAPLLETKIHYSRIPLPRSLLKVVAAWSEWRARRGENREPKVEKATIDLLYNNYWFSNHKLKETGYDLLYPDARFGLKDTIDWYKHHDWLYQ
ncbi:MAG: NAD-dependent epimerase/dehydratase family protein [Candidatus Hermodarchaeia archaeon]|jgi:nucleoside-diphosphate-sugar epimerase